MARLQSSFAMSAAFCSKATIVRPESSAAAPVSCCPLGVGANGTMVPAWSGASYPLIALTPPHDDRMCTIVSGAEPAKIWPCDDEDSSHGERITHNDLKPRRLGAVECSGYEANVDGRSLYLHRAGCASAVEHVADTRARFGAELLTCPPMIRSPAACRPNSGFRPRSPASRRSRRDPSAPERSRARP